MLAQLTLRHRPFAVHESEHVELPRRRTLIGTPDRLAEKILDAQAALGISRFIGKVDSGGLPAARVHESIAGLATEIAPAVRAATGPAVA